MSTPVRASSNGAGPEVDARIAIIGSGFSGLGMAIRLKQAGVDDFVVLERADDVGGTWRDNTYPGCQCDVPSHLYSFSFAPNPGWSRTFSCQPEIWEYLRRCAREHDVLGHVRFGHDLREASWDDEQQVWRLETSQGSLRAHVLVSGIGALSDPSVPDIPGLESFEGTVFHSAQWDHDHALEGERVAVVGTGASAIQFVPRIAPRVGRLHVFQRTPPWIMPHTDRPVSRFERFLFRRLPFTQRLLRSGIYFIREALVLGLAVDTRLMAGLERVGRAHLRRQLPDRELRRKLRPRYRLGCKRILISNDYYPALARDNVEVVTDGIREVRPRSIVTADGAEREVDTIILGTGFHVTDMPAAEHLHGRGGVSLAQQWQGSPQAYLGATIAGFPNLFMLLGPNTGLGHNSVVFMIEAQIAYVMDCLRTMDERGVRAVEIRAEAQAAYNARVQEQLEGTVWNAGGCRSWYLDANGRNSTLWPSFTWRFWRRTRRFDPDEYRLAPAPTPAYAEVGEPAAP
jgi:cation diffusion facilitator CzcD-associated flavoprotein CzcO